MQCLTFYGSPDGPYAGALTYMTLFCWCIDLWWLPIFRFPDLVYDLLEKVSYYDPNYSGVLTLCRTPLCRLPSMTPTIQVFFYDPHYSGVLLWPPQFRCPSMTAPLFRSPPMTAPLFRCPSMTPSLSGVLLWPPQFRCPSMTPII